MLKIDTITKEDCEMINTLITIAQSQIKNLNGISSEQKDKLFSCSNKINKFFDITGYSEGQFNLSLETLKLDK